LDAKNIELRIPAYVAGETEMIALFEKPDEAPFYGSNHLLVFSILHPKLFAKHGAEVKNLFASTWYQWTKNGNFAVQYGATERSGTADRAYHVKGAQKKVKARFSNITKLNDRLIEFAQENGYVETLKDKAIGAERGYPLETARGDWGKVRPTVPLNYYVQGTAMWWMSKAMVRCQDYIDELNATREDNYAMIMQVHDELVFDFPYVEDKGNLPLVEEIRKLMELGGDDIGMPTPCSIDYHPNNWSESL
jgi:hypothetical protein